MSGDEKLRAELRMAEKEIERLRRAIEDAPHDEDCSGNPEWEGEPVDESKCDCWKSTALAPKERDPRPTGDGG